MKILTFCAVVMVTLSTYGGLLCHQDYFDPAINGRISRKSGPALFAVYDRHQSTSEPLTIAEESGGLVEKPTTFNFEGVGTCWFLSGKVYSDIHSEIANYRKNNATQYARLTTMKSYIHWDNIAQSFRVILGDSYNRAGGGVIVLVHSPFSTNRDACEREHRFILKVGSDGWGLELPKKMPERENLLPHEFHYDPTTESATALLWPGNNEELNYSHGVCYFRAPDKIPFLK